MTQPTTPAPGEDSKGFWRNLILWALLALLLRWLVVEPRWIPSGSMLPTLQLQDRILVENCLLYTSPSPRDRQKSRMPSSA